MGSHNSYSDIKESINETLNLFAKLPCSKWDLFYWITLINSGRNWYFIEQAGQHALQISQRKIDPGRNLSIEHVRDSIP